MNSNEDIGHTTRGQGGGRGTPEIFKRKNNMNNSLVKKDPLFLPPMNREFTKLASKRRLRLESDF